MATRTGPVGPFPPGTETDEQKDEYDKLRRRVLWQILLDPGGESPLKLRPAALRVEPATIIGWG
jgi:hypothetical protein